MTKVTNHYPYLASQILTQFIDRSPKAPTACFFSKIFCHAKTLFLSLVECQFKWVARPSLSLFSQVESARSDIGPLGSRTLPRKSRFHSKPPPAIADALAAVSGQHFLQKFTGLSVLVGWLVWVLFCATFSKKKKKKISPRVEITLFREGEKLKSLLALCNED
jgi:hypothetical protein